MSTAYAIESIDILRKRRLVCAIFAQARSNLRLHFALLAASFELCLLFAESKSCVLDAHDIAENIFLRENI